MSCGFSRPAEAWVVYCGDGLRRHDGTFRSRAEALHWSVWGHIHPCPLGDTHTPRRIFSSGLRPGISDLPIRPTRSGADQSFPSSPVDLVLRAPGKGGEPVRIGGPRPISGEGMLVDPGTPPDNPSGEVRGPVVPVSIYDLIPALRGEL